MRRHKLVSVLILLALAAVPAAAQQFTPAQAVAAQLGQQVGLLMAENADLRAQLAAAQARIRELESAAPEPGRQTPPK